jgi:hypothetical protein
VIQDKPSDPGHIRAFSSPGIVFSPDYLTNLVEQFLGAFFHFPVES